MNAATVRLFVAITMPEQVDCRTIALILARQLPEFRISPIFHLTLVFIGSVDEIMLDSKSPLDLALQEVQQAWLRKFTGLALLAGGHIFGNTISLKLAEHEGLSTLEQALEKSLAKYQIAHDTGNAFVPHVALGRISRQLRRTIAHDHAELLAQLPAPAGGKNFAVDHFTLYQSLNGVYMSVRRYEMR